MQVSSVLDVPYQIALAISMASSLTGADFDYLVQTAARESNFKPAAQATTSSASGLFQFIESTWLRTIKEDGARYGLGSYSNRIFRTRSGRYYVPDSNDRKTILNLRNNPAIASTMAGVFAKRNAEALATGIRRKPTGSELYLAHFLGATNAIKMINLTTSNPRRSAARSFPRAAKANRRIFYDGSRHRSVAEVYRKLTRQGFGTDPKDNSGWSTMVVRGDRDLDTGRKSRAASQGLKKASLPKVIKIGFTGRTVKRVPQPFVRSPALVPANVAVKSAMVGSLTGLRGSLVGSVFDSRPTTGRVAAQLP